MEALHSEVQKHVISVFVYSSVLYNFICKMGTSFLIRWLQALLPQAHMGPALLLLSYTWSSNLEEPMCALAWSPLWHESLRFHKTKEACVNSAPTATALPPSSLPQPHGTVHRAGPLRFCSTTSVRG